MPVLVTIVKTYLMPGTTWFLVIGVALGLVLLYGSRSAAWGRRWLVALVLLYVTMSVPAVALWGQRQVARSVVVTPGALPASPPSSCWAMASSASAHRRPHSTSPAIRPP